MTEIDKKLADVLSKILYSRKGTFSNTNIKIKNLTYIPESKSKLIISNPILDFKYLEITKDGKYYTDFSKTKILEVVFNNFL